MTTKTYISPKVLEVLEMQYSAIDAELKELQVKKEQLRNDIIKVFDKKFGHKSATFTSNQTGNTLQRNIATYKEIIDSKVEEKVSKSLWNVLTIRAVDRDLFFAAVKAGKISKDVVDESVQIKREVDRLTIKKGR